MEQFAAFLSRTQESKIRKRDSDTVHEKPKARPHSVNRISAGPLIPVTKFSSLSNHSKKDESLNRAQSNSPMFVEGSVYAPQINLLSTVSIVPERLVAAGSALLGKQIKDQRISAANLKERFSNLAPLQSGDAAAPQEAMSLSSVISPPRAPFILLASSKDCGPSDKPELNESTTSRNSSLISPSYVHAKPQLAANG